MKPFRFLGSIACRLFLFAAIVARFAPSASAQSPASGMIEGRVFNSGTGEYLEFVRLTVAGTSLEAFTDSSGEFRLVNVPAGIVKLTAFRTGVAPQSQMVTVAPGQVVRQDFELSYLRPAATEGAVVKLDKFVVSTSTAGPIAAATSRQLLHAYAACVSFVDAQIGRLLAELDTLGLRENTIVVVWGDHGWHVGEYGIWGKATNYEIATRVPLIVSAPGTALRGQPTRALVEFVDVYPSLCELAGLPLPPHLAGRSFVPLLSQPDFPWKQAAFSQFPSPALRQTFFAPCLPQWRRSSGASTACATTRSSSNGISWATACAPTATALPRGWIGATRGASPLPSSSTITSAIRTSSPTSPRNPKTMRSWRSSAPSRWPRADRRPLFPLQSSSPDN